MQPNCVAGCNLADGTWNFHHLYIGFFSCVSSAYLLIRFLRLLSKDSHLSCTVISKRTHLPSSGPTCSHPGSSHTDVLTCALRVPPVRSRYHLVAGQRLKPPLQRLAPRTSCLDALGTLYVILVRFRPKKQISK